MSGSGGGIVFRRAAYCRVGEFEESMKLKKLYTYCSRFAKIRAMRYFESVLLSIERVRIARILNRSDELVLVFTVGKVGSSAVYESFRSEGGVGAPVFHIHSLNAERLEERRSYYLSSRRKSVPFHLVQGRVLSELIPEYRGRMFVVTLIRDPIQRELSGVFQDSFNFSDSMNLSGGEFARTIQEQMKRIVLGLPEVEWLDREVKGVFGVDFIREDFDVKKGFCVKEGKGARIGLARVEGLEKCFSSFCTELFQRDVAFELLKANLGEEKFYDEAYRQAKASVKYDSEELEVILKMPFMQKFYPDMISVIRDKWREITLNG